MTDGEKVKPVQFNYKILPEIKNAFIATKPKGVSMRHLTEAALQYWIKLSAKERQKYLMK